MSNNINFSWQPGCNSFTVQDHRWSRMRTTRKPDVLCQSVVLFLLQASADVLLTSRVDPPTQQLGGRCYRMYDPTLALLRCGLALPSLSLAEAYGGLRGSFRSGLYEPQGPSTLERPDTRNAPHVQVHKPTTIMGVYTRVIALTLVAS
jgi:hypothetical protein